MYERDTERRAPVLSDAQMETIAEKAAEKAIKSMTSQIYQEIGKGLIHKFLWILGSLVVGGYVALKSVGWIK